MTQSTKGAITVYRCRNEKTGIDAIVSLSIACKMLAKMHTGSNTGSKLAMYQTRAGGLVSVQAQVPASVAASVLAMAKRAGIPISH